MEDWEKNEYRFVTSLPDMVLVVENEGQGIKSSNYWDSPMCKLGLFYMIGGYRALRLLVPPKYEPLATIKGVSEVIVSRGPWAAPEGIRPDAIEVLLEDHTDTPFSLNLSIEQCDMLPSKTERGFPFSIWGPGARKLLELPCSYRIVPKLPWLKPWRKGV